MTLTKLLYNLEQQLTTVDSIIKSHITDCEELISIMSEYIISSGGKRFRPSLTILTAQLLDYKGTRHLNLAAAVEFIHTATLLHDDVVDNSMLRRGKSSAKDRWGNKASILVGDYLFSQAFRLMSIDGDKNALDILSKASSIIAEGEVMQLVSISSPNMSEDRYFSIIRSKTAELFAAASQVGAVVAGASFEYQYALRDYGLNFGMAFQIIDDVLDYSSDQKIIGKSIGDDFSEGKITLPSMIAYKESDDKDKNFWERTLYKLDQHDGDLDHAIYLLNKYNAIEKSINKALEFAEQAKTSLQYFCNSDTKQYLLNMIDSALKRVYQDL